MFSINTIQLTKVGFRFTTHLCICDLEEGEVHIGEDEDHGMKNLQPE